MEKYNELALAGWMLLRVTPDQLQTNGLELLRRAMFVRYHKGFGQLVSR